MKNILLQDRTLQNAITFWKESQDEEISSLFPLTRRTLSESIQLFEDCQRPDTPSFGKAIYANGNYIGDIWCFGIDEAVEKQAFVSILIFDKATWGKGIGQQALSQFCRLVFEKYQIDKLCAFTYSANKRSAGALEKSGFKKIEEFEEDGVLSYYYELEKPLNETM
jgi:[ribosomal protein S5]-alanine N-acetyltransferase